MSKSTLNPGKVSPSVRRLREAALKEMNGPGENTQMKGKPTFDVERKGVNNERDAASEFDRSNGVAKYPGQNVEHIGNGSGGIRK